jgi:hypothetical protein
MRPIETFRFVTRLGSDYDTKIGTISAKRRTIWQTMPQFR